MRMIKALLASYIVTGGLLVVLSFLLYKWNLTKEIVTVGIVFSYVLSTFVGGIIMFLLGSVPVITEGILLGITLGMLIYIAIFELFHQIHHMEYKKIPNVGIVMGIMLLVIALVIKHFI